MARELFSRLDAVSRFNNSFGGSLGGPDQEEQSCSSFGDYEGFAGVCTPAWLTAGWCR